MPVTRVLELSKVKARKQNSGLRATKRGSRQLRATPLVLAGVVLAMSLLGLLATWFPARRALSIDPMTLLHEE